MREFTIENDNIKLSLLDYGARIKEIFIKKVNRNIVLNYKDNDDYLKDKNYYGATIGPNANRIKNGEFSIGEKTFKWDKNDGDSNLHSSEYGFDKLFWEGDKVSEDTIVMTLKDAKPFKTHVKGTFKLMENKVLVRYEARSQEKSIMNMTNHTYFNLSGEDTVDNHIFKLYSRYFTPFDGENLPIGTIEKVDASEFDLREGLSLKDLMEKYINTPIGKKAYDHNFISIKENEGLNRLGEVRVSDLTLEISSDSYGFQFYTGNNIVENNREFKRKGFCIEPQLIPDSANLYKDKIIKGENEKFILNILYEIK